MPRTPSVGMTGTIGFDDAPERFRLDIAYDPDVDLATFTVHGMTDPDGGVIVGSGTEEGRWLVKGIAKGVRTLTARLVVDEAPETPQEAA
jgi:hypothetical protein